MNDLDEDERNWMCELTDEYIKEILDYNPETGIFTWKIKPRRNIHLGSPAGSINKYGYRVVRIDSRGYPAHRLAWVYVYGEWPKGKIDHINGIRTDNKIANLRVVTPRENAQNRREHREGQLQGVHLCGNTFTSRIYISGRRYSLGSYLTEKEAHLVYKEALDHLDDLEWFDQFKPKGYTWVKAKGKWQAQIRIAGKNKYLGCFCTEEEAREAYLRVKNGGIKNE